MWKLLCQQNGVDLVEVLLLGYGRVHLGGYQDAPGGAAAGEISVHWKELLQELSVCTGGAAAGALKGYQGAPGGALKGYQGAFSVHWKELLQELSRVIRVHLEELQQELSGVIRMCLEKFLHGLIGMESLVAAHTHLSLQLLQEITRGGRGNMFFSPLSVSAALAMVKNGAAGNTAQQIQKVLGFPEDDAEVQGAFSKLLCEMNTHTPSSNKLILANRIFGEQSFSFHQEFLEKTGRFYQAELQTMDFINQPEESRKTINSWVEEKTEENIRDLLAEGDVDSLSRLVLINAVYLKSRWESIFRAVHTREEQFWITKLENCLTPESLLDWIRPDMMDLLEVEVFLPRFRLNESLNLSPILKALGMQDAFDPMHADFSKLSPNSELVLSTVVHQSTLILDEEGTEAAAASGAVMSTRMLIRAERFRADHPFLFFIRHNNSGSILFCGRFSSPQ
ncbi:hypothetical protein DNTS_035784 [Danionella cerebrum]|uniref:Serpin domain-containing protein n=1 Tax=Danionella cerebrum TaxID=2873325 RepID=A0A553QM59_9TELE|nr:hypothetical protein DNTS_035784 [Danionella translucida]